mgnify:CR=1 FL=1|jgi:hypothetical protein|tara:strand:+ start:915 stop:2348 length:1434 start_codon:yes stop_codon:yes gene_type:complete
MSSVLCSQTITGDLSLSGTLTISASSLPTFVIGDSSNYKIMKDTVSGDLLEFYSGNAMGETLSMNSSKQSTFNGKVTITGTDATSLDVNGDIVVGDDITMDSSGAVLTLGTGGGTVTLQHNGGFGGTLASNSTSGGFTIDSAQDITLDAAGSQVYFSAGGTARYTWNLDSTPELDVTGDFTIDGSGDITIDAADDLLLKSGSGTHITLDETATGGTVTTFNKKTSHPDSTKATFGNGSSSDGDAHIQFDGSDWEMSQNNSTAQFNIKNVGQGNIALDTSFGDVTFGNGSGTIIARMDRSASSFQVDSGSLILGGTGRIQGIDTVSSSTDAANKNYVDNRSNQYLLNTGFDDNNGSTSYYNIPISNTTGEVTSSQYYNNWCAPADGTIKYIMMMHTSNNAINLGAYTTQLRVIINNVAVATSSELTASNSINDGSYIEYSPDQDFSKGDRIRFAFGKSNSSMRWRGTSVSIVIEFDRV